MIKQKVQAMADKGLEWDFVKELLEAEYHSSRGVNTEFELETLPVAYCAWSINQIEKLEAAA